MQIILDAEAENGEINWEICHTTFISSAAEACVYGPTGRRIRSGWVAMLKSVTEQQMEERLSKEKSNF